MKLTKGQKVKLNTGMTKLEACDILETTNNSVDLTKYYADFEERVVDTDGSTLPFMILVHKDTGEIIR